MCLAACIFSSMKYLFTSFVQFLVELLFFFLFSFHSSSCIFITSLFLDV